MKNCAIILASGSSRRFGGDIPKQFITLDDETILEKSIRAFEINSNIYKKSKWIGSSDQSKTECGRHRIN